MSKPFDATLKRMLDDYSPDWAAWLAPLFGLPSGPLTPVDPDLSAVQPAADKVFRLPNDAGLLHLEVQAGWDGELPDRMLLYNVLLGHRENQPVQSVVILLRREANATAVTGTLTRRTPNGQENHVFRYGVVRLWELPADELLAHGLGLAPLGLLTDDAADRLPELVPQLAERVERDIASEGEQDQLLTAAFILLGMRYDRQMVRGLFQGVQKMRESSTYQGILEEGRAEGEVEGERKGELKGLRLSLTTLLESRFGSVPPAVADRIQATTDVLTLRGALRQVLTISRPEDLLL